MTFIEQQQQRLSVHFVYVFLYSIFCKELVIFNISLVLLVKPLLSLNE